MRLHPTTPMAPLTQERPGFVPGSFLFCYTQNMTERFKPHPIEGDHTPPERPFIKRDPYNAVENETTPEQIRVREFLNSLDENILREIFAEHFQKAGGDVSTMNFVPLNEVRIGTEDRYHDQNGDEYVSSGTYGLDKGVSLYSHQLPQPTQILWTLIHEQLHAVSSDVSRREQVVSEDHEIKTTDYQISGVRYRSEVCKLSTPVGPTLKYEVNLFKEPNEGLTELLTEKIFCEYVRRTGITTDLSADEVALQVIDRYNSKEYSSYRKAVDFIIGLLTVLTKVPEDTARNALIRTYFRNGALIPDELYNELEDIDPSLTESLLDVFSDPKTLLHPFILKLLDLDSLPNETKLEIINAKYQINARIKKDLDQFEEIIDRKSKKQKEAA